MIYAFVSSEREKKKTKQKREKQIDCRAQCKRTVFIHVPDRYASSSSSTCSRNVSRVNVYQCGTTDGKRRYFNVIIIIITIITTGVRFPCRRSLADDVDETRVVRSSHAGVARVSDFRDSDRSHFPRHTTIRRRTDTCTPRVLENDFHEIRDVSHGTRSSFVFANE